MLYCPKVLDPVKTMGTSNSTQRWYHADTAKDAKADGDVQKVTCPETKVSICLQFNGGCFHEL